jgi:hypothetical protein
VDPHATGPEWGSRLIAEADPEKLGVDPCGQSGLLSLMKIYFLMLETEEK